MAFKSCIDFRKRKRINKKLVYKEKKPGSIPDPSASTITYPIDQYKDGTAYK